ncbi:hypothetical protein [uncultured Microbacterium sp.]|uniref:hypothetical protein n=1 Tax=uncultured Microbacterium sp. TaxID=191216 RepID=UPI00260DD8FA|nr:hypothetical protein [uncultured Microbacterium sp.]
MFLARNPGALVTRQTLLKEICGRSRDPEARADRIRQGLPAVDRLTPDRGILHPADITSIASGGHTSGRMNPAPSGHPAHITPKPR